MLFAAAAVLSSVLSLENGGLALAPEAAAQPWELASALLGQFGTRMAAVFALAVSTAGVRVGGQPRALAGLGWAT
jgi:hypothetical protein